MADYSGRDRDLLTVFPASGYESRLNDDLSTVLHWLRSYVSEPSPHLGRHGPVCPFVPAALGDSEIRFSFHYEVDGHDRGRIRSLLVDELHTFDAVAAPPNRAGTSLASLLVVLPDTGEAGWAAMDEVYEDLKEFAVGRGLMVGQFIRRATNGPCEIRRFRFPDHPSGCSRRVGWRHTTCCSCTAIGAGSRSIKGVSVRISPGERCGTR